MKKLTMLALALLFAGGCSSDKSVVPDHKKQIDSNTARIMLLEANDSLQDLRLDDLESRVNGLEVRVSQTEADIIVNSNNIVTLFNQVATLDSDLADLRDDLNEAVAELQDADSELRVELLKKIRKLRKKFRNEIANRQAADANLQANIDSVASDLDAFEAAQSVRNFILTSGLFLTNLRISQLQSSVASSLNNLDNRLDTVENQVASINSEIQTIKGNMLLMQAQLDDVESRLVSVVYPCGENNSKEVLLQTQDGLVAYFQKMKTVTTTVEATETVPAHTICTFPLYNVLNFCPPGHVQNVPQSVNNTPYSVSFQHQVLEKAYLAVLGQGNYGTTDGMSCTFSIDSQGQLVGGQ